MTRVAVIDIGTVTARLAVADVESGRVTRLAKSSSIVNLGQDVDRTGRLREDAQRRLLGCVDLYLASAREAKAPAVCCTLTSAARDAENSADLLAELERRGLDAQVIPGEVEGSLTFLGVAQDFAGRRIMVADNGGGSTEVAVGSLAEGPAGLAIEWVRSVNVGCRRLTEKFLAREDPPSGEDLARAHELAAERLSGAISAASAAAGASAARPERLVVTGGTATTLVAVEKGLEPYDPRQVHLQALSRADVDALERRLAGLTVEGRAALPGIQAKRAPVILGGTVAIAELMRAAGFDELTVSESDLLFGLSIVAAATLDGAASPLGWRPGLTLL
jgi:exopolyphosphatase/guanosine-5'-triphosphate,3'-diphosphate pyrophosphatase